MRHNKANGAVAIECDTYKASLRRYKKKETPENAAEPYAYELLGDGHGENNTLGSLWFDTREELVMVADMLNEYIDVYKLRPTED